MKTKILQFPILEGMAEEQRALKMARYFLKLKPFDQLQVYAEIINLSGERKRK